VTCVRYQLQGYAETLVWDIDVMMRHMQKLEIGIEGREAIGESTQQLMDHMKRRIPDMMNWRKRCNFFLCSITCDVSLTSQIRCSFEHERDRRLLIQQKIDELTTFMKQ
jgi:hypothetical protein